MLFSPSGTGRPNPARYVGSVIGLPRQINLPLHEVQYLIRMTYLTVQNLTVSNYLLETPIFESDLKLKKENDLDFYHLARMTILSRSI